MSHQTKRHRKIAEEPEKKTKEEKSLEEGTEEGRTSSDKKEQKILKRALSIMQDGN
jgi:hypothetical protein